MTNSTTSSTSAPTNSPHTTPQNYADHTITNRPPPPLIYPPINTTINVKNSVALELTYTNYLNWKKVIRKFLGSKKLLSLVDGTLPCPTNGPPTTRHLDSM
ncbi:hypothetical protein LIER_31846 [Lithospermum erythrorhizon]|uniref:Retrotransposon Copia-like N-terminal domain-containing protein n=1 Tax=Lithospermum erythrorhizon TaxID=34254 RepID=A0AAV3RSA0_LITER